MNYHRIVLTMSLAPALDATLSPGAFRCLALVRSLAGRTRLLDTLACSLGKQLGRCTNTIRTYRDQLVAAGYLWWTTDRSSGITRILVREAVEPPERSAQLEAERQAAAWPRHPTPARWQGRGGAQFSSPINQASKKAREDGPVSMWITQAGKALTRGSGGPQAPLRTVAEQIAIALGV